MGADTQNSNIEKETFTPVDDSQIHHKVLAILMTVLVLYVALTFSFNRFERLASFLLLIVVYIFSRFPLTDTVSLNRIAQHERVLQAIDALLILASVVVFGYLVVFSSDIIARSGDIQSYEVLMAPVAMFLTMEATRRTIGWAIPIFTVIFLIYAYLGPIFPAPFGHPGYSTDLIMTQMYVTTRGIFGFPLRVMFDFVFLFVLFGALLELSGGGKMFLDLSKVLVGKVQGGPAKLSIIASASMGMVSGSAVANALTTGAFTIPTMKDQGYNPEFAAGVESAASSGGQLLPPVMGAAVFVMMDITGISYNRIITAAVIPAVLTFFCAFVMIHLQSKKSNLEPLPDDQIPSKRSVVTRLYYFIPVIALLWLLFDGSSVRQAIVMAIGVLLALTVVIPGARLYDPRSSDNTAVNNEFMHALELCAKRAAPIVAAAACIGIVLGIIGLTGIGLAISSVLTDLAGQSLLLALVLTMVLCIIFGMSSDTLTVYILLSILVAPGIVDMGIPELSAHLFIFYFGLMAMVTPPVCIAAYAAATIAESDPIRSGFWAWKLSLGAFLLPFAFVYDSALLLDGSWVDIVTATGSAMVAFTALAVAVIGYISFPLNKIERAGFAAASILLIHPSNSIKVLGGLVCLLSSYRYVREIGLNRASQPA
ncbi:TRAP transporter permease [Halovenus marina]|uniref:TRAP transporter permease n=1 Tax=Halovenus marina TaxID=3396621 RepID=UPI003F57BE5C